MSRTIRIRMILQMHHVAWMERERDHNISPLANNYRLGVVTTDGGAEPNG